MTFEAYANNCTTNIEISLYRRLINHKDAKNSDFPFILWGYFDGMKYRIVDSFKDFFDDELNGKTNLSQNYEIHRLLLYSLEHTADKMESLLGEDSTAPLIVLSQLKLNDTVLKLLADEKGNKLLLSNAAKIINLRVSEYLITNNLSLKFLTLSSIGYSDLVLVIRGDDYQIISDLVNFLRGLPSPFEEKGPEKYHLLKSTYTIPGLSLKSSLGKVGEKKYDLSVRISLKKMINYSSFKQQIADSLQIPSDDLILRTVFGKYDLDLSLLQIPFNKFLMLFCNDDNSSSMPILDPQNLFHRTNVGFSNTRWLLRLPEKEQIYEGDDEVSIKTEKLGIDFKKIDNVSLRLAFHQIVQNYYQIEMNEASEPLLIYELRKIIKLFYSQIIESNQLVNAENAEDKPLANFFHCENIRMGLELISQLLNSRVQAFRLFSEIPSYDFYFIRASTKIFVVYMTVLEEAEKLLNQLVIRKRSGQKKQLNVFVSLGNFDKVESRDIFPNNKNLLIAILLSMDSFYDIRKNFLLLFHEIAHYVPMKQQNEVNKYLTSGLSMTISERIVLSLLSGDEQLTVKNFEIPDKSKITILTKALGKIIFNILWENIKTNSGKILHEFTISLANSVQFTMSFNNNDFVKSYDNLISLSNNITDKLKGIEKDDDYGNRQELFLDIENLIRRLGTKIADGENLEEICTLWDWLMAQILDKGFLKTLELQELKNGWKNVIIIAESHKREKIKQWVQFIGDIWSEIIGEIKLNIPLQEPNINLLDHLAKTHMLENTQKNYEYLANEILHIINSRVMREKIDWYLENSSTLIEESFADFNMCILLDISWQEYKSIISNNHDEDNQYQKPSEMESKFRANMIGRTYRYISESEPDNETHTIILGLYLDDIPELLNKIDIKYFDKYIGDESSIKYLQKYYKDLENQPHESQVISIKDIELIENIWALGIGLVHDEG